jgi:hypothetical protein
MVTTMTLHNESAVEPTVDTEFMERRGTAKPLEYPYQVSPLLTLEAGAEITAYAIAQNRSVAHVVRDLVELGLRSARHASRRGWDVPSDAQRAEALARVTELAGRQVERRRDASARRRAEHADDCGCTRCEARREA